VNPQANTTPDAISTRRFFILQPWSNLNGREWHYLMHVSRRPKNSHQQNDGHQQQT